MIQIMADRWLRGQLHRVCMLLCVVFCAALLAACAQSSSELEPEDTGGSRISPDIVAQRFFESFGAALADPNLSDSEHRAKLAELLAEFFSPNERNAQRIALNTSLANFAEGLKILDADEFLTLEMRLTDVRILSEEDDYALVRPVNGNESASVYLFIGRTNERGVVYTIYEQEVPFEIVFGREDGAVPVVRIGDRWYLTEG
jgi:hypothetical protein